MNTRFRPISGTRFLRATRPTPTRNIEEVIAAGGLHIFGTERHEARRIDNQLRGRAGRQGDPGSSRFYLSLEDDLMRIFAKEWVSKLLQRLGMEEGVPIESRMITRRIEAAQKAVEGQNFEARKHLLEYDDVMNKQREAVYGLRRRLLEGLDQKDLIIEDYVSGILGDILERHCPPKEHVANWDLKALKDAVFTRFGVDIYAEGLKPEQMNRQELGDAIFDKLKERYDAKEKLIGAEAMRYHERMIMLSVIDAQWKDHLLVDGPPERGHQPARLRTARSAGRIQARVLRHVRRDDAALPGRDGSLPVPDADHGTSAGRGCEAGCGAVQAPSDAGT